MPRVPTGLSQLATAGSNGHDRGDASNLAGRRIGQRGGSRHARGWAVNVYAEVSCSDRQLVLVQKHDGLGERRLQRPATARYPHLLGAGRPVGNQPVVGGDPQLASDVVIR